jgi:hypothetical protein
VWSPLDRTVYCIRETSACGCVCARGVRGVGVQGVEGFTLGELVDRHVMEHAEAIAKMASEAVQEGLLEESLQKVLCFVCTCGFRFLPLFRFSNALQSVSTGVGRVLLVFQLMWASLTAGACRRLVWVCVIACRVLTLEGPSSRCTDRLKTRGQNWTCAFSRTRTAETRSS